MYLKILSRDDDRTNTLIGIRRIEFFHRDFDTPAALSEALNYADLVLIDTGVPHMAKNKVSEYTLRIGCFNITYESGKTEFVNFDGVAFLCNDTGKTVDRFVAN